MKNAQDRRVEKMLGRIHKMTLEDVQKEMSREIEASNKANVKVSAVVPKD